jgi:hypothetical protein
VRFPGFYPLSFPFILTFLSRLDAMGGNANVGGAGLRAGQLEQRVDPRRRIPGTPGSH